jgi:hypothetical protein
MANTVIQLRNSTVTGNVPSSLANGEISINSRDGKFFYSTPSGSIITHYPYLGPAGLNKEIQFNDSGTVGSSEKLTFDKTTGTLSVKGVLYANTLVANTGFIQFADGSKQYTANSTVVTPANVSISTYSATANGAQTVFNIGFSPSGPETIFVTIDGVVQPPSSYSTNSSANTITLDATPANGEQIGVVSFYTSVNPYIIPDASITKAKFSSNATTYIEQTAADAAVSLAIALG